MSKAGCRANVMESIKITTECYEQILGWSMSYNEIGFLCAGRDGRITRVFRIENVADNRKHCFLWNKRRKREVLEHILNLNLEVLAEGHSHPHQRHLRRPS